MCAKWQEDGSKLSIAAQVYNPNTGGGEEQRQAENIWRITLQHQYNMNTFTIEIVYYVSKLYRMSYDFTKIIIF